MVTRLRVFIGGQWYSNGYWSTPNDLAILCAMSARESEVVHAESFADGHTVAVFAFGFRSL